MSRRCLLLFAVAAWLGASPEPSSSAEPRKIAFVVGVAEYHKDGFSNLNFADEDALALAEALKNDVGFESVEVLVHDQATGANIRSRFAAFLKEAGKLGKSDVVFVSLAGHGIQRDVLSGGQVVTQAFFCPYDALKADTSSLVPINDFIHGLRDSSGSSQNLMIVDACRDDPNRSRGLDGGTIQELPPKVSVFLRNQERPSPGQGPAQRRHDRPTAEPGEQPDARPGLAIRFDRRRPDTFTRRDRPPPNAGPQAARRRVGRLRTHPVGQAVRAGVERAGDFQGNER
jgi:hypothetical protein